MNDDTVISVLREVYAKRPSDVPFDLVQQCFAVEAKYLYERNREVPISYLRKLVTLFIENDAEPPATR
jgi:hypothetical protein